MIYVSLSFNEILSKKKKKNPRTILNLSCSYFSLLIGSELLVISDLNPLAATKVIYLFT